MKKKKLSLDKNDYSPETVKAKRKLPRRNIVLLVLLILGQILLLVLGAVITSFPNEPIDVINEYNVTVTPRYDGSLDITYDILWTALSKDEPLTWVDVGLPNADCDIYSYTLSPSIESTEIFSRRGNGAVARIYLEDEYDYGETVRIGFEVNQRKMLSKNEGDYLYELVPGWFNEIPVESYCFKWRTDPDVLEIPEDSRIDGDFYVWEGSLEPGGYVIMRALYSGEHFGDPETVEYAPFDPSGAHNDLEEEDGLIWLVMALFAAVIIIPEVYVIDSFVSYGRGRGFITEHGHPVHTYGRTNPAYLAAANAHTASNLALHGGAHIRGGRGGGGGCACACACACAGGGRAGCSVKDGVRLERKA